MNTVQIQRLLNKDPFAKSIFKKSLCQEPIAMCRLSLCLRY